MKAFNITMTLYLIYPMLVMTFYASSVGASERRMTCVVEIREDKLIYETYMSKGHNEYDLSGLAVSKEIIGKGDPFKQMFWGVPDFKTILLKNGYASLKQTETAEPSHIAAQKKAKSEKKGQWSGSAETLTKALQVIKSLSIKIWHLLLRWLPVLISIGVVGYVASYLYKKFYIQRRLKLLIIGEPSAGKTALYLRLLDPEIERKKILELAPTKAMQRIERKTFIPKGKFELYPSVSDVPGSAFSTVWDEFGKVRSHAIIVVLAPTDKNTRNPMVIDEKYIYTQLGYVQAYIEGGIGSHITKRPRMIIIFVNKFDLFCDVSPGDSAAESAQKSLEKIFKDHIESARMAGKKVGIPVHVVFGSALESWSCNRVLDLVGNHLYGL